MTHEGVPPYPTPCPECGGERVVAESAYNYMALKKRGLTGLSSTGLWALVCGLCGHTTFYAKEPQKLVERRPDNGRY